MDVVPAIDLRNILTESHENKWVAIAADYSRVIAAASDLGTLDSMVKDPKAIFHFVMPHNVGFAPMIGQK